MRADDQEDVIAFLSQPDAYSFGGESSFTGSRVIERLDTHISIVWLVGDRAFKLKRAVRYDYVDFSTIERRRSACEAEVRLNRRTAPSLYLGTRPVTRESTGELAIGGRGVPLDWLVEMARFDQETLFDRLAQRDRLAVELMEPLAEAVARLHAIAAPRADHGGRAGMAWVVEGNATGLLDQGAGVLDRGACERLSTETRAAVERHGQLLETRREGGKVRECHGDLHLRNICLLDASPTLFDAVEFNDQISCIDVFYDLAFLLMDLWRRDLRPHANVVFNEYLGRTRDFEALVLLPLFLSCRAGVRAKTSATAAKVQADARQQPVLEAASREYLKLAQQLLRPRAPCLVAVGGFSGSGKSTLARRLAPSVGAVPGAVVARSDRVRKELFGVSPLTRLGPEGYATDVTVRVYKTMAERAYAALVAGHSVIVDAVYARAGDRDEIGSVARRAGVPFAGLWIEAPEQVLARRLREREADASDATVEVLQSQIRTGVGALDWYRLDGSRDAPAVQEAAAGVLRRLMVSSISTS